MIRVIRVIRAIRVIRVIRFDLERDCARQRLISDRVLCVCVREIEG